MNVILIVVDALRSDHLGVSGYSRNTSPNIDKLINNATFFNTSIPTAPGTEPSIVSLLTGLYPHSNGVRFINEKLDSSILTLPQILKTHGYTTIGHDIEMRYAGIDEGFDVFNPMSWRIINKIKSAVKTIFNNDYEPDATEILTNFAIKNINKLKNKKFFMYLHYFGLHWPYMPPAPYDNLFDPAYKGKHTFNMIDSEVKRGDMIFNNNLPKEEINHAIAHYDGSIKYIDLQIGKIMDHLEKLNLTQDTLIILTSDHGEYFGEHKLYFDHCFYLYDEGIKLPMVLKHPKLPTKRINDPIQHTDLLPTLIEFLDLPKKENIDGINLMPLIMEDKPVRKFTFAETGISLFKQNRRMYLGGVRGKWRMIRTKEWKLIYIPHPEEDIYELYNLVNDPKETTNLIYKEKGTAENLKKALFSWIGKSKLDEIETQTELKSITDDKKVRERLKALGYLD